jgi:hypothetical protein
MATAPVPTNSSDGGVSSGLYVTFFDDQLEASLWLNVPGYFTLGDNELNMNAQWNPIGGSQTQVNTEQPGNFHITTLAAHTLAGSYSVNFRQGGGISGSIETNF